MEQSWWFLLSSFVIAGELVVAPGVVAVKKQRQQRKEFGTHLHLEQLRWFLEQLI